MDNTELDRSVSVVREAIQEASRNLIERETLVELVALAAVAQEHVLIIGAPGTAKSEAVRRIAKATGGNYFEYLLGRFTEPSEIFGPVDLRKLKEGIVQTETTGMLPEAEIAFLDEIFLGSTAILNTLLGILNERVYRRGHTALTCPLRVCVGASNSLPRIGLWRRSRTVFWSGFSSIRFRTLCSKIFSKGAGTLRNANSHTRRVWRTSTC